VPGGGTPMVTPTAPYAGARPDAAWVQSLLRSLHAASWERPERLGDWVPAEVASQLLRSAVRSYRVKRATERRGGGADDEGGEAGTLVRVGVEADAQGAQPTVVVVGDTHGHLHDLLHILSQAGARTRCPRRSSPSALWGLAVREAVLASHTGSSHHHQDAS